MIKKLFPIFVAMVVVLAFGSVHAQTTVNIALPDGIIVSEGGTVVVVAAPPNGSISFNTQCMEGAGFTVGHPLVRAIIIDSSDTGAVVVSALAAANVHFTGRLVNLVLLATCSDGGNTYRVYSGDVSPTPTTIFTIWDTAALLAETDRLIITGVPVSSAGFSSNCMADLGLSGVTLGAQSVVIGSAVAPGPLVNLSFPDPLPPGTRVSNPTLIKICVDGGVIWLVYVADVVSPIHGGSLLVAAPAGVTLDTDAESVAKSDSDPDGISNFVCIQPGSAAEHTELWCDVPIERGDRIVGFHSPLVDPDSGITYWWAELEY